MSGISYIITVYNKAAHIPYMLKSLSAQTGDFTKEFIFIDDGSTDNSLEIIKRNTADWSNTIYITQDNQGPAIATNNAVAKATQRFLKMVDGDDVIAPYAGKIMREIALNTGAGAIYSCPPISSRIDFQQGIQFAPEPQPNALDTTLLKDTLFHVLKTGWSGSSNLLVDRNAFLHVGGCDESVFVQDWSLPLRIAQYYDIAHFSHLIAYSPTDAPDRVMDNHPQMIHDLMATQYHFIRNHPELHRRYKALIAKRCSGRAWKWDKRENKAGITSKYFWLYLANTLKIPLKQLWVIEQCQQVFHQAHNIRIPTQLISTSGHSYNSQHYNLPSDDNSFECI